MDVTTDPRASGPVLLSYRPWRGTLRGPTHGAWAIARVALYLMLRRKLFWGLYGLSVMIFLFFFYGQYLQTWIGTQLSEDSIRLGSGLVGVTVKPSDLLDLLRTALRLDGSGYTYRNFIWFEGYIAMIVLALAGSVIVGNDFHHGSIPFYLSKPINRWHYLIGKWLAVGVFINLMTTLPAVLLYLQYGLIDSWHYYHEQFGLFLGIVGYGAVLTISLGLLLLATACWLRRTVPMVMVWTALFVFGRMVAGLLVDGLRLDDRWRLVDLWNDMYLVGNWCLRMSPDTIRPTTQPEYWEAAAVLGAVSVLCLIYLNRRIQAVEIV